MRIIVCGGRDFIGWNDLKKTLDEWLHAYPRMRLVSGSCPTGADAMAEEWAERNSVLVERHPADWSKHGKAAGPLRNEEMAATKPDYCLVFPGGSGTADMVRRAKAHGINVVVKE